MIKISLVSTADANTESCKKANFDPYSASCQILLWPGHIALVDWVHRVDGDQVTVDICQSSSGGPKCNVRATLTGTSSQTKKGYQLFKVEGGTPAVPVGGYVHIMSRAGFSY